MQTALNHLSPVTAARLTFASVKAQLAAVGVKLSKLDGEFRAVVAGEGEQAAYYSDDLDDALATGLDMARRAEAGRVRLTAVNSL